MTGRQEAEEAAKENTGSYNFATAGSHAAAGFTWTIAGQAADRVQNLFLIGGGGVDGAGPPPGMTPPLR